MSYIRWGIAIIACVPMILTTIRLLGWWPCDVACQGGGYYQRIFGLDVLWLGLIGYTVLALLTLLDAWRKPRWSSVTGILAGGLAGVSLFYLYIAWSLSIVCPFCLTIHGVIVVVLLAVAGDAAGPTAVALLLGTLGANAAFHHQVVPDILPPSPPSAATITTTSFEATADANRHRGVVDAPVQIDYALSLQCSHCADQHQPLLDALAPAIAAGRLRLIIRPVVRPADAGSVWLAECALAAAAHSADDFDSFIRERLGTRAALTREEMLTLGGDLLALDRDTARVAKLVTADQHTLASLGYRGSTPFVAIRHGTKITRFVRDLQLAEIVAAIDAR